MLYKYGMGKGIIFITIWQKYIFLHGNCGTNETVLLGRVVEKVISTDNISCKGKEAMPFLCSFG